MESPVYYGNSMFRVFTPGERLVLQTIPFEELQTGDIITVNIPGKKQYVHRVIRKSNGLAVTMGDNNPAEDDSPVTARTDFQLVTAAVSPQNGTRPIARGRAGMREFRRNRLRRRGRIAAKKLLRGVEFLFFWRKTLHEQKVFGQEICYYRHSRPVARKTADGRVIYARWQDFFKYRLPPGDRP